MNSIQFNLAPIYRPDSLRSGIHPLRGDLVFRSEMHLMRCGHHFSHRDQGAIRGTHHTNVRFEKHEGRDQIHHASRRADSARCAAFCTTLFGFSLSGFLPIVVRTIFHRGPGTYALLLVFSAAGSIRGALIVAVMEKLKGQGRLAVLGHQRFVSTRKVELRFLVLVAEHSVTALAGPWIELKACRESLLQVFDKDPYFRGHPAARRPHSKDGYCPFKRSE